MKTKKIKIRQTTFRLQAWLKLTSKQVPQPTPDQEGEAPEKNAASGLMQEVTTQALHIAPSHEEEQPASPQNTENSKILSTEVQEFQIQISGEVKQSQASPSHTSNDDNSFYLPSPTQLGNEELGEEDEKAFQLAAIAKTFVPSILNEQANSVLTAMQNQTSNTAQLPQEIKQDADQPRKVVSSFYLSSSYNLTTFDRPHQNKQGISSYPQSEQPCIPKSWNDPKQQEKHQTLSKRR